MSSEISFGNLQAKLHFSERNGKLEGLSYGGKLWPLYGRIWRLYTNSEVLEIDDMQLFRHEAYENALKLIWQSEEAEVAVTISIDWEAKFHWNIQVQLYGTQRIDKVQFPLLEGLRFEEENHLLVTWQNGRLLRNPVENFLCKGVEVPFWVGRGRFSYENEYPAGLSFQYTAFYSEKTFGYYFATEDPDAFIKTYTYQYNREHHALDFSVINYPENMGRTKSWCMPYDFVMTLFRGDWQVATRMYRRWAIQQKWCKEPLIRKHLPEKVKRTELWRINHTNGALGTRTQEFFDTAVMLRDTLNCNLGLHWYGWNLNEEHDWDTPEYFDEEKRAMGWPEQLRQWNKRFSDAGIVKIPYTNARLWERTTKSWKTQNGFEAAVKGADGKIINEPWTPQQHLTTVCPACALWQRKVADMCREYVLEEGFDGAYLDQVASFNAVLCFDESHPHPRGGGSWWNTAYHRMLSNVRCVLGDERIMTTESCCETYIDVFDLFLILDTNFQYTAFAAMTDGHVQQLPLFSMIYGDYALSYGSICRFSDSIEHFEFNYIRNILWGILPSLEGGDMQELKQGGACLDILKKGVDFFKENRQTLLYGYLCEIPEYYCSGTCEISWVAKDEQKNRHPYTERFPAVSTVLWEDSIGEHYLFAYNFSTDAQIIELSGWKYEVPGKQFLSQKFINPTQ